jgi:hypothetical protein
MHTINLAAGSIAVERVSGPFDVAMTPVGPGEREGNTQTARMLLDKQYFGDLAATGKGQMLTAVSDAKGSAAYVAIERVTGTLKGRKGSFVIQHAGTMRAGTQQLAISIVPDSGTDQLTGIAGTMAIRMVGSKHFYDLDYTLPTNSEQQVLNTNARTQGPKRR